MEDNLNAIEEVEKKEEVEKSLIVEHNEGVFHIDFECASRQENNPITCIAERKYEEKDVGKGMEDFEDEKESTEITFQQWSPEEIKFYYQKI